MSMKNSIKDLIIPKSDQLNADQLLTGKMVIKITAVKKVSDAQPLIIHYEGEDGRPFKPCKTARRQIAICWGETLSDYVGKSLELYNEPTVRWAGKEVGGIRICGASDISGSAQKQVLSEARQLRKEYMVRNLGASEKPTDHAASIRACKTLDELVAAWNAIPKEQMAKYVAVKDEIKAALSNDMIG